MILGYLKVIKVKNLTFIKLHAAIEWEFENVKKEY